MGLAGASGAAADAVLNGNPDKRISTDVKASVTTTTTTTNGLQGHHSTDSSAVAVSVPDTWLHPPASRDSTDLGAALWHSTGSRGSSTAGLPPAKAAAGDGAGAAGAAAEGAAVGAAANGTVDNRGGQQGARTKSDSLDNPMFVRSNPLFR